MKVSITKFYREVTGSKTVNRATTAPALKRWNVPFDEDGGKTDVVDVVHLPVAIQAYRAEEAERAAKRKPNGNGHDHDGDPASVRVRLAKLEAAIDVLLQWHHTNAQRLDIMSDRISPLGPRLDDVVNHLSRLHRAANVTLGAKKAAKR